MSDGIEAVRLRPTGGQRELIVVTKPNEALQPGAETFASVSQGSPLDDLLSRANVTLRPLFGPGSHEGDGFAASLDGSAGGHEPREVPPELAKYLHVDAPDAELEAIAAELRAHDAVEAAYVKPAGEPPVAGPLIVERKSGPAPRIVPEVNDMQPSAEEAPAATPDFSTRQGYLDPAPGGINARYAWTLPGGRGAGINIIDCEWSWNRTHEDLTANQGSVVVGSAGGNSDHGTAVSGEMGGSRNGLGIIGICPDAFRQYAAFSKPSATVIKEAADKLSAGDLLLLEIHRPGPGANGSGQDGYIAIEWWPDDYDAIKYAVGKGIIVVEAAGNGARNLDAAIYDTPGTGFPSNWSNPFRRSARDSGAILVGAGAPPPNTHGNNWGADRSRLDFSNHGAAVDAQGWGREVTTTGYGDLQGGSDSNLWYTDRFSGTSSASPIVTGALAATQGVLRAQGLTKLDPARARRLLRQTGTPQQDEPGRPMTQRIGNRPDLRQLIAAATTQGTAKWAGIFRPDSGALWFDVRSDLASFNAQVTARFNQGLYLSDVIAYKEGSQTRWAGVFRPGSGALWFDVRSDLASFNADVVARFDQGLYLTDALNFTEGGESRWAGIFRAGSGAQWFDARPSLASFNADVTARFNQGLYLTTAIAVA